MLAAADYDPHFRRGQRLFGPPVPAFVRFFAELAPGATVLDLGCGQGRHALLAARRGHVVTGVDLAPTGVAQMLADAAAEGLKVQGHVNDVTQLRTRRRFDVVMLARVLIHLVDDRARLATLDRLAQWVRPGGHALVSDSVRTRGLIRKFFIDRPALWDVRRQHADFVCAQRR